MQKVRKSANPSDHPARYNVKMLPIFAREIGSSDIGHLVLDPFAGTGERLWDLYRNYHPLSTFVGIEIQRKWQSVTPAIVRLGNALYLEFPDNYFDVVCTSPTFGNRMADHHDAKDDSPRNTYYHRHGEPLEPDNSGILQWGDGYRDFHRRAWKESVRVLRGRFILNIKDHIRNGERQMVTDWHIKTLEDLGLTMVRHHHLACESNKQGANGALRVPYDSIIVFEKNTCKN